MLAKFLSRLAKTAKTKIDKTHLKLIELIVSNEVEPSDATVKLIVHTLIERGDYLQAARWLSKNIDLGIYDQDFVVKLHSYFYTPYVMIAGGEDFLYPFWVSLDPNPSVFNEHPFVFDRNVPLPFRSETKALVVMRENLDRANEEVFHHIGSESSRVLQKSGALIVESCERSTSEIKSCIANAGLTLVSDDRIRIQDRFDYVPRIRASSPNTKLFFAVPCKAI